MAEIKWFGHACVRVRGRDVTVLMDPVPPSSGYTMGRQRADIVTVSHPHPGHNALDLVRPGFRAITGPGEYEIKDTFITGIRTFHDDEGGRRLGKNTSYLLELEDLVICHLGDIGHVLTDEQAEQLSMVDLLLIPVGGGPTIDAERAVEIIGQVEPSIVIPLQYRTERGDHERDPLDRFLRQMGVSDVTPQDSLSIRKADLGETVSVIVLTPGS
uniref:Lactamase n=1 Tax=Thermorudis peleae TaxID=1382356 RepID=A0A831T9A4_9BACT